MSVSCDCCVLLSGRDLCDELIPRPEESYRLWCVSQCDQKESKTSTLKRETGVGRRGRLKKKIFFGSLQIDCVFLNVYFTLKNLLHDLCTSRDASAL
jgi:hypothetical protein